MQFINFYVHMTIKESTQKIPTYKEIADLAGVSAMTITNYMRSTQSVRPDTRGHIETALRELNIQAAQLRAGSASGDIQRGSRKRRARVVSVLACGVNQWTMAAPVYADLLHGVEQGCRKNQIQFQIHRASSRKEVMEFIENYSGMGTLLFGPDSRPEELDPRKVDFPMVRLLGGPKSVRKGIDVVSYDDWIVGEIAAEHLAEHNCQKVAFIGTRKMGSSMLRSTSFGQRCAELGMESEALQDNGLFRVDTSKDFQCIDNDTLETLLETVRLRKVDGIFSMSDQITVAIYGVLQRWGLMPQQDVKIISCNNELPFLNALYPRPATIDIRMRAVGRMAVNHLVYLANQESDHTREARRILTVPQLILPD